MNKFAKSLVLAVFIVVSFGVSIQSASARVVLPLDGSCPSDSPIRTQVDNSLVCLSLDEFCPSNPQWFMAFDSPLKCPDYQNNPSWKSYVATTTTSPPSNANATTTTSQIEAVEDDGISEEDFADLGVSQKSGRFDIRVSSSFLETEMVLRAYKKGSKSVTWYFKTNQNGQYRIITSRLLRGFTMSIWLDGEKWDSLVIR